MINDLNTTNHPKAKRFTPEEDDFIKENYPIKGLKYCFETLNRDKGSVCKRAKTLKLPPFRKVYDDVVNFEKIDNADAAYFLGYFWADGHITRRGVYGDHRIVIVIQEEDAKMVENSFCKNIHFHIKKRKAYKETWKKAISFRINNKSLYKFFLNFDFDLKSSVSPTKILNHIPERLRHYFWRGYFDGDGTVGFYNNSTKSMATSSSYDQDWQSLIDLCKQLNIVDYKISKFIHPKKGHKSSMWRITNIEEIRKFGAYIYKDYENDKIGLQRKHEKYQAILKHCSQLPEFEKTKNGFTVKFRVKTMKFRICNIKSEEAAGYLKKTIFNLFNAEREMFIC